MVLRTTQGTSHFKYDDPSIWHIANQLHASDKKIIVLLMLRVPSPTGQLFLRFLYFDVP